MAQPAGNAPEKSARFAFADHDFIFTVEIVKPGTPIFNFVSMYNHDVSLSAKNIRLVLQDDKIAARTFAIETGNRKQPMIVLNMTLRPRSSFGMILNGDFGRATEIAGVIVRLENEEFRLAPLTEFDFESLVKKVNSINLNSPDFMEDWQVLRLQKIGARVR